MSPNTYLDALLTLPIFYDDAAISRDGKWAAWTWYRAGPTADVYVVPTDGSAAPLRLTDTGEDTELVGWTPDSRALLVRHDQQGDERVQLFRVDLERPGVLVALTEPTPSYYIHGGALHPNGRWLFYGANVDERGQEIEATWIYRHDLATGERRALARPEQPSWGAPLLNEQGTHILYERQDRHPGGVQIWMVDVEGNDDHEVLNVGDAAKVQAILAARWPARADSGRGRQSPARGHLGSRDSDDALADRRPAAQYRICLCSARQPAADCDHRRAAGRARSSCTAECGYRRGATAT